MAAEMALVGEAGLRGHARHRLPASEERASFFDPYVNLIRMRRQTEGFLEGPHELETAGRADLGKSAQRKRLARMLQDENTAPLQAPLEVWRERFHRRMTGNSWCARRHSAKCAAGIT